MMRQPRPWLSMPCPARCTYLHDLKLLNPLLCKFLYSLLLYLALVLPERVSCSSLCVFSKIVGGELASLAMEGAILKATSSQPCLRNTMRRIYIHAKDGCRMTLCRSRIEGAESYQRPDFKRGSAPNHGKGHERSCDMWGCLYLSICDIDAVWMVNDYR